MPTSGSTRYAHGRNWPRTSEIIGTTTGWTISEQADAESLEHDRQSLKRFEAIDVTGFSEQEKLNRALMLRNLHEAVDSARVQKLGDAATQFNAFTWDTLPWRSIRPFAT